MKFCSVPLFFHITNFFIDCTQVDVIADTKTVLLMKLHFLAPSKLLFPDLFATEFLLLHSIFSATTFGWSSVYAKACSFVM